MRRVSRPWWQRLCSRVRGGDDGSERHARALTRCTGPALLTGRVLTSGGSEHTQPRGREPNVLFLTTYKTSRCMAMRELLKYSCLQGGIPSMHYIKREAIVTNRQRKKITY